MTHLRQQGHHPANLSQPGIYSLTLYNQTIDPGPTQVGPEFLTIMAHLTSKYINQLTFLTGVHVLVHGTYFFTLYNQAIDPGPTKVGPEILKVMSVLPVVYTGCSFFSSVGSQINN
jgi:hypothetical protein